MAKDDITRPKLVQLMTDVEPALSSLGLVPVTSHFWFTGKEIMAYDGRIAIEVECKTPFAGAVPPALLALLKTSTAETPIEFKLDDAGTLHVKAASSKFKLAIMPKSDFVFKMPALPQNAFPCDAGRFLEAMTTCMYSLGNDTSHTDHLGVTLIAEDGFLFLFGYDRATLSSGRVKLTGKVDFERIILPTNFCKQLLRIGAGAKKLYLEIADDFAMFECDGIALYGRLEELDKPIDFMNILDQALFKNKQKLCELPENKLPAVLERACIITDAAVDKTRMVVSIKNAHGHFDSVSERGEVHDECGFEKQHPDCLAHVDPVRIKDGIDRFTHILFTEEACIMANKEASMVYLIQAKPG